LYLNIRYQANALTLKTYFPVDTMSSSIFASKASHVGDNNILSTSSFLANSTHIDDIDLDELDNLPMDSDEEDGREGNGTTLSVAL
jgi:hypothetical protein